MKRYHQMFCDMWSLFRKYFEGDPDPAYWERLITDARGILNRYDEDQFCCSMLVDIQREIERIKCCKEV